MTIRHEYSSAEKNSAICRKELEVIQNGRAIANSYEEFQNMHFFKVKGLARFWEPDESFNFSSMAGDILNSCVKHGVSYAYAIIGDKDGINVYIGTQKVLVEALKTSYVSSYPGIEIQAVLNNPLRTCQNEFGGLFTGIPTDKLGSEKKSFQIEKICRGMLGRNFTYLILATGISNIAVTFGHEKIMEEMESVYPTIQHTVSGGAQGNLSANSQNFNNKNYFENLELLEQYLKTADSRGMWRVNGYYASDNQLDGKKLGNMIKASYSGEYSKPEPFRVIENNDILDFIRNTRMMADLTEHQDLHPLGRWYRDGFSQEIRLYDYKYQTILNSDQLATMCQFPTKEYPGYYIDDYVEFDVSNRSIGDMAAPVPIGEICIAGRASSQTVSNRYFLDKNDFTRHALIIGVTGGGKTNTSKSILNSLWNTDKIEDRTPFMVIESAKREYWELRNIKGFEDLLVFTLGSEAASTSVKYRINPFETISGISLQTHIDYLLSTFKASFDLYPPLAYILEKSVYEIYDDRGWDIVENKNHYGLTEYPTLSDLHNKIDVVVDRLGYHSEIQSNVKAALKARIYSLMIGGKGSMMNTPRSLPIHELLSRPVVMELEDLGDDETKSFVIGLLLVQLYEYRKSLMTKGNKELSHILLIEEAHRLLKNVVESGEGGNTRARSVEFFCNLLAEIRTFGQGIIISDQIPTKLAVDTIKNTNLKIVHRTVALEDREAIGRSMNMNPEQIEYLSSLRRGYAAIYAEGDNKPKCVKLPLMESYYDKERAEVISEVQKHVYRMAEKYDEVIRNHAACSYCEERCRHFSSVKTFVDENIVTGKVLENLLTSQISPDSVDRFMKFGSVRKLHQDNENIKRCIFGYILEDQKDLNDGQRQKIIADYLRYTSIN
ncbi:MAG: ATP-binding protein [Youngiibacter sp.]|nr:ATP-binding protein [Youngiibacter sp.]